jgi:hypothetical protein
LSVSKTSRRLRNSIKADGRINHALVAIERLKSG